MDSQLKITFVTIVPSPYQRDFFAALARREGVELKVYYLEAASPDSPWPEQPLRDYERILPGGWLPFGGARWHYHWRLPDFSAADFVVLSSLTSLTGQWLMRHSLKTKRWLFWGERLRQQSSKSKQFIQQLLTEPLQHATAIVGIGRKAEEDYRLRFPSQRHFNIPYHCDLSSFRPKAGIEPQNKPVTFLFCGQMIQRKGLDTLLHAFDQLVQSGKEARLLLVGREADLPEFLKRTSAAAQARIDYEGFQAPETLPKYFDRADVFVLPSRYDGWGVVVNQALGAGLPVIASDAVGAAHDLVEENVNGLKFPAGDVASLQRCLERFVTEPGLVNRWSQASFAKAANLTPEAGAEKWVKLFKRLAENA